MLKIGITGGIGSGKTTVCKIFEVFGIPVFYADEAAKNVMVSDGILIADIRNAFGHEAYTPGGELNRKYLADIVFTDEARLEQLNSLVHPAVFRAFDEWVKKQRNAPYVIKEAALLFESSSYKLCDYTVLITAPVTLRMKRVMLRDSISENEVKMRMDKQLTDDEKASMADFIIKNNEQELLVSQSLNLHNKFLALASGK